MNREGKRCLLYSRVSTEIQVDGYSLDGAKEWAETVCRKRGNDSC